MVCYLTMNKYILSMVNSGTSVYAFHKTISDNCKSLGTSFNCSYRKFLQACDGFVNNLSFDLKECFTCINCGISPRYFTGDGKENLAPLQRKLREAGITELSSHPDDNNVLSQGSQHKNRVFISDKSDRDALCNLLTGGQTVSEFCASNELKNENAKLISKVVKRLEPNNSNSLPESYHNFFEDIIKNSPVAGYIQVTSKTPLILLRKFCVRELDIRNGNHQKELQELLSQLPTFWPQLVDICAFEDSNFLPHDVSKIVLKLLEVRKQTFQSAPQRYAEDYIPYDKTGAFKEDPSQFYTMHELKTYPNLYTVANKTDEDFCAKNFPQHHDFADGIFSIGCSCELSITYGFEIMIKHESPRHFLKFLMNRKLNLKKLKGVIFDFACGLHRYCLNREPKDFEFTRFIVDGSHYQGHKKLKRKDTRSGKKAHVGCSSSYNFNKYKTYTKVHKDGAKNSQGREQMHSILDKLAKSLRQKNYNNFMKYMICFFAIRNLMIMKKL